MILLVFGQDSVQNYRMSNADVNKYFEYHNQNMNLLRIGFDRIKQEIIAVYKSKSGEDYLFELPVNDPRR